MAAIRSRDTKPEVYLRKLLYHSGFRYRKNDRSIPGTPDIWIPKYRTAVFVHGCFWHRHEGCRLAYMPGTRVEFWQKKFDDNVRRDLKVRETLEQQGIRYVVVWECTIRRMRKDAETEAAELAKIVAELQCNRGSCPGKRHYQG